MNRRGIKQGTYRKPVSGVSVALLSIVMLLVVAFIVADPDLFGAKYSFDERKIQAIAQGVRTVSNDPSFQITGEIYRALGLANEPLMAAFMGIGVFLLVVLMAAPPQRLASAGVVEWIIILGSIALAAIYLGSYSKDFFVLVAMAIILLLVRVESIFADVAILLTLVVYASLFRQYWFLVAAIFIGIRFLVRKGPRLRWVFIAATLLLLLLSLAFPLVLGVDLDHYRVSVNEGRNVEGVNTLINGILPTGGVIPGFVNSVWTLVNFWLPLDLALRGGAIYAAVALFLAFLWITIFKRVSSLYRAPDPGVNRCFALLFAVTLVQSIFEPDYGSYVRHLSPILVLAIYIVVRVKARKVTL